MKPADAQQMIVEKENPLSFVLEQTDVGRGDHVQTLSVDVWQMNDNEPLQLNRSSYGQFYSDEVFIVRWRYKLNPQTSVVKADITRDRVAYWIWQGSNASPNERGISALFGVCFNEEKGPHVSVSPLAFLLRSFVARRSTFFKNTKNRPFSNCSTER